MTENNIWQSCLDHLGGESFQVDIAIEEMAELTKALLKYKRQKSQERLDAIVEEIADVRITLNQLQYMYDPTDELVFEAQSGKMQRLVMLIEEKSNCN